MVNVKLSIVIPTYNRKINLLNNINTICKQLTEDCELVILDNASDYDVEKTLRPLKLPFDKIRFLRNDINLGLFGNILKSFEVASADWLYILGDDDSVVENSISQILKDITSNESALSVSYKWFPETNWSNNRPLKLRGFNTVCENIEAIHHIMFLGGNIYNRKKMIKNFHIGHYYQSSGAPHLCLLFKALDDNDEYIYLSDKYIVDNKHSEVPIKLRWDRKVFFENINVLLDLPLLKGSLKSLFGLFRRSYPLKKFLHFYAIESREKRTGKENFKSFLKSTYCYRIEGGIMDKIYSIIYITSFYPFYYLALLVSKLKK